jgi:hypothetical protein
MRYKSALAPGFAESSQILKMAFHHGWMQLSQGKLEGYISHTMHPGLSMGMLQL